MTTKQFVGYQCKANVYFRNSSKTGVIIGYSRNHELAFDDMARQRIEMHADCLDYTMTPIYWIDSIGYTIDGQAVSHIESQIIGLGDSI